MSARSKREVEWDLAKGVNGLVTLEGRTSPKDIEVRSPLSCTKAGNRRHCGNEQAPARVHAPRGNGPRDQWPGLSAAVAMAGWAMSGSPNAGLRGGPAGTKTGGKKRKKKSRGVKWRRARKESEERRQSEPSQAAKREQMFFVR